MAFFFFLGVVNDSRNPDTTRPTVDVVPTESWCLFSQMVGWMEGLFVPSLLRARSEQLHAAWKRTVAAPKIWVKDSIKPSSPDARALK